MKKIKRNFIRNAARVCAAVLALSAASALYACAPEQFTQKYNPAAWDTSAEADAPPPVAGEFVFTSSGGGTSYIVSEYTPPKGETAVRTAVPENYNGLPVTGIGAGAFAGVCGVVEIALPASVVEIGAGAFAVCADLEKISLPGVSRIGERGFYNTALVSVVIPESLRDLGKHAFEEISALKSLDFSRNTVLTEISQECFKNARNLTDVNFAGSAITKIGDWAFDGAKSMENYSLPQTLRTIGEGAFRNNDALRALEIPASVTTITKDAFGRCKELTRVTFAENSQIDTVGNNAFGECRKFTRFELPSDAPLAAKISPLAFVSYKTDESQAGEFYLRHIYISGGDQNKVKAAVKKLSGDLASLSTNILVQLTMPGFSFNFDEFYVYADGDLVDGLRAMSANDCKFKSEKILSKEMF